MANSPWSVKGIDPETREAAKLAARRAGVPIGVWLTQAVRQAAGIDAPKVEVATPTNRETDLDSEIGSQIVSNSPIGRAVVRISERLDRMEEGLTNGGKMAKQRLLGLWR
jgi:hypothetical protein